MKFQEAFDAAFEIMKKKEKEKNRVFAVSPGTAKTLAFLWTMIAISKNMLDDMAYIDDNNEIKSISFPGEKEKPEKGKKEKGNKSVNDDKPEKNELSLDNGDEQKEQKPQ